MLAYFINSKSPLDTLFLIVGGLSIFLFGLNLTKENLRELASKRIESTIHRFTNTTFKAILTGVGATVIIQSSSGVTALVVGFIASGYLSFERGLAIMIGANLGTCTTAFIFGLDIENASLIIISISSMCCFLSKSTQKKRVCEACLGIGLIFLGLQLMGFGFDIVAKSSYFKTLLLHYSSSFTFSFFLGIALTFVIQSSSAIVGLLEQIYGAGLLTLTSSIAILLGSNIGTTLTGFIATVNTNPEAKKAVVANVIFNILGAILFIPFTSLFVHALNYLVTSNIASTPELVIAFSHLIFNVVTVFLAYFFFEQLIGITNMVYKTPIKTKKVISLSR